ncbi:hypothetical protein [Albidovulum sp.]|jgi:hypothetical protein|uniref:hypothetical protein n=1 Tax=Albidovulum sp. TaxID=1872424 RepID=UPI0039B92A93
MPAERVGEPGSWERAKSVVAALLDGVKAGITAPGRALRGEPVSYGDALATAGLAVTGSLPMKTLAAPNSMASRTANLYDFPTKSEVGDALGRSGSGGLDLEGRPLVARPGRLQARIRRDRLEAAAAPAEAPARARGAGDLAVPHVITDTMPPANRQRSRTSQRRIAEISRPKSASCRWTERR